MLLKQDANYQDLQEFVDDLPIKIVNQWWKP
jgi:hypothetical protein